MRSTVCLTAVLSLLLAGCEPPEPEPVTPPPPATTDSLPPARARVTQDAFDGCYYQGQRYSVGGVRAQDGVLKKCAEENRWHNVDGFGNLIPEDPSVEDTLSAPDTTTVADTTDSVD